MSLAAAPIIILALVQGAVPPISGTVDAGGTITVGVTTGGTASTAPVTTTGSGSGTATYPRTSLVLACPASDTCGLTLDCTGGTPYFIYSQASATSAPVNTGQSVCVEPSAAAPPAATTIPADVVAAATTRWATTTLRRPDLVTQPSTHALVGVPSLFWLRGRPDTDWTFTLSGIPLHVHATETWTWSFGDGATRDTATGGRPFDAQQPPDDPAYADGYVQHPYTDPGRRIVTVTAVWSHVTLTRTDTGASVALPGRTSEDDTLVLTVGQLRTTLSTP